MIKKNIEIKGKRKFPVYVAVNSVAFKNLKKSRNLWKIYESGLVDFLNDYFSPKCMVVFGSYARGEDYEDSDIDFLECESSSVNLSDFEKLFGRKIELHFKKDFNKILPELKNNILNGVVLSGYLEVF